jgi:hypothetical protein
MATSRFILPTVMLLVGCNRSSDIRAEQMEDSSITFPGFFAATPVRANTDGGVIELTGAVLRALDVAATDFLGPQDANTPCVNRRESHQYRVIQQQRIIFVRIDEDPRACGLRVPGLDSGAQYAVGTDGRILRRLRDGEPDMALKPADAGPATFVPDSEVGATRFLPDGAVPLPFPTSPLQDAGTQEHPGI